MECLIRVHEDYSESFGHLSFSEIMDHAFWPKKTLSFGAVGPYVWMNCERFWIERKMIFRTFVGKSYKFLQNYKARC